MPNSEKFLFLRSFDPPAPEAVKKTIEEELPEEPEIIVPTFSEEQLNAARAEGEAKGREEGIREASEATERLIGETTQSIKAHLENLFNQQRNANAEIFTDAVNAGIAVVKKCFPKMNLDHGVDEIEGMIGKILPQILEEPRVIISVNNETKQPLSERMETIIKNAHFDGRAVIRGEDDIPHGDCRIEWSNGGAARDLEDLLRQIDLVIDDNLAVAAEGMDFDTATAPPPAAPQTPEAAVSAEMGPSSESIEEKTDAAPLTATAPQAAPAQELDPVSDEEDDSALQNASTSPLSSDENLHEKPQDSADDTAFAPPVSPAENTAIEAPDPAAETQPQDPPTTSDNASMEPDAEVGILNETSAAAEPGSSELTD